MKQTITIQTTAGASHVRAIRRGEWAAHPAPGYRWGIWALTHVPSGGRLALVRGRLTMARRLRALAALPPCPAPAFRRDEVGGLTAAHRSEAYLAWISAVTSEDYLAWVDAANATAAR